MPSGKKFRVLYVEKGSGTGGSTVALAALIANLPEWIVPYVAAPYAGAYSRLAPVARKSLKLSGNFVYDVRRLRAFILENRIDILHLNNDAYNHPDSIAAGAITGRKIAGHSRQIRPCPRREKFFWRFLSHQIAASAAVCGHLCKSGYARDRISVIYEGVELPRLTAPGDAVRKRFGIPTAAVVAVTAGSLREKKGLATLIAAAEALADEKLYVLIVGGPFPGEECFAEKLRALSASSKMAPRIVLAGQQDAVFDTINAANFLVFPTLLAEGFGRTPVEAALLGLPSIASRIGAVPETVVHEKTGLLVTPGAHDELAAAMKTFCDNPALRRDYGAAAKARAAELFSPVRSADLTARLYTEI